MRKVGSIVADDHFDLRRRFGRRRRICDGRQPAPGLMAAARMSHTYRQLAPLASEGFLQNTVPFFRRLCQYIPG